VRRRLRRGWTRLFDTILRRHGDDDLAQEIESHIDWLAEEDIRRGLPPEEAYRRARIRFGSVESAKERYRDQRGLPAVEILVHDLRHAVRGIRRSPGLTLVAVLSLTIGIGANAAIFSLVDAVLLRPLAYQDPDDVFVARELDPQLFGQRFLGVNPTHAREWAVQCPSLKDVALVRGETAQLTGAGDPASLRGARITHNLLALLGVEPIRGRPFRPDEEQAGNHHVVMLSEAFWRSRFNADPSLVGRTILLDGETHQVVGIVPASFRIPSSGASNRRDDVFRPLVLPADEIGRLMGNYNYFALLRVKPGASAGQALAEVNVVQARFARQARVNTDLKAALIPVHEFVTDAARPGLWTLSAAVGAVLLIVCINLANLLLSRSATRTRETAIRTALGATRGRLFRQALTESLLLAVAGGALGILLAGGIVDLFLSAMPFELPRIDQARVDSSVLAFVSGLTILTALVFGALPAWRLTRDDPQEALRSGSHTVTQGRRALRLREALICLEVGVSAGLLIIAALLGSSLVRLLRVDKGFDDDRVLTADITLGSSRYATDQVREQFIDRLLSSTSAIPGAEAVAIVTHLPARGDDWNDPIYLEGAPRAGKHTVNNRYASPGYFRAMNIAVRQGRTFQETDRGRGVAMLSEKAARLLWPDDPNPIGRVFIGEDDLVKTLVGVVADVRASLQNDPPPTAYYPYWQRVPEAGVTFLVRTTDASGTAGALRAILKREDPQLPMPVIRSMADVVGRSVAQRRFQLSIMCVFAGAALLVSSLGIYGVVSYSVTRRRNELGVRLALGAQRVRLLGLVIRQGMKPVVVGLMAGVGVALLVGRSIRSLLFEVQPGDPVTIAGVTILLLVVGVLACLIPARRAAATDAVTALRFQ
jgi:putative ABC transport system permease protein